MTGHTAPPWEVEEFRHGLWNFRLFVWRENQKVAIAEIPFVDRVPRAERAANQRLIKAAPALRNSAELARAAIDATIIGHPGAARMMAEARASLVDAIAMASTPPPSAPSRSAQRRRKGPKSGMDGNPGG